MKHIVIKKIRMMNFKKFIDQTIEFGDSLTSIFGQNYRGKSSVADAFSWVMFNKSSTGNTEGSQFRPRRYDENGKNIDHVDVVVEMLISVDGEELKIKKTQRQEWVRHHGDDFDSYMGDKTEYEWNDVPVTPTNHKKKVDEIISEEVFRMLSNPANFPTLPKNKQREFLLKNVANITDEDVFAINPEFQEIREAMGKKTLEELSAKTKKEIAAYKEKQKELPIRIDQESKRIENIDFSEKESELAKLEGDLADVEIRLEDTDNAYVEVIHLKSEKHNLEIKIQEIENGIQKEHEAEKRRIRSIVDNATDEFSNLHNKQIKTESALEIHKITLNGKKERLDGLREKFTSEMKKEMPEDAYICPTCGQIIPEDQREKVRADFENEKAADINEINEEGTRINAEISRMESQIKEYEKSVEELKQKKIEVMAEKNRNMELLNNLNAVSPDPNQNSEYKELSEKIEQLVKRIESIDTTDADAMRERIKADRSVIQESIDKVKESLSLKSVIEKSKAAVEEMRREMSEVTQSLANCEKLDSMIDKFNKAKMDMLSERINDKFRVVKWKMFEQQKNGRFAETCVCMVNGSSYGENTTSATERMIAGMDIIHTLHSIYGISAPIFLDDADLYNDWNVPDMDCQLIKLCVSEDEDLRVEVE